MDVLYYIGSGSHHQNRELLYSLRALEMHCRDLDRVWIVGNRPHFLNDKVQYLWVADSGFGGKTRLIKPWLRSKQVSVLIFC